MTNPTRTCADCSTDISDRHGNATRCQPCSSKVAVEATAHTRPRSQPCAVDDDECVPGRLRRGLCYKHYVRAKDPSKPPEQRACEVCSMPFTTTDPRRITCSVACREWRKSHPGEPRLVAESCLTCGGEIPLARPSKRYCSNACRGAAEKRRSGVLRGGVRVKVEAAYRRHSECVHCGSPIEGNAGRRFCSRQCEAREYAHPGSYTQRATRRCEHCGTPLGHRERINRRHCSDRCTVLANQAIRRVRKKDLAAERFSRSEIFERDNWICHICGQAVNPNLRDRHPLSASLDHLIPLALPGGPGHIRANVALAHLRCNLSKNARVRPEDWTLHLKLLKEVIPDGR
jgi:5-methylcytosine-specific restriction endonuclease McrA